MQNPFTAALLLGGEVERVGKLGSLPYPLFPSKEIPKTKGLYIDVPPNKSTYSKVITPSQDIEFFSVAMACTGYLFPDYWEFTIGSYKIFESIYTKELPQTIQSGNMLSMIYPVKANTPLRLDFVNNSGTSKQVFFDVKFFVGASDISNLNLAIT